MRQKYRANPRRPFCTFPTKSRRLVLCQHPKAGRLRGAKRQRLSRNEAKETVISQTVTITQESGEVIVELPDGEHRTFIEAKNTFAPVGRAIKLTEALLLGWSLEDHGKAFRLVPGDVEGPGDMFL